MASLSLLCPHGEEILGIEMVDWVDMDIYLFLSVMSCYDYIITKLLCW